MPANTPKLGILAGGGDLPLKLAQACQAKGRGFLMIGLEGCAGPEIEAYPHEWSALGSVARTYKLLRDAGCSEVVLAGNVRRPDFRQIKPDRKGAVLLAKVVGAAVRGDGALLSVIIQDIEHEGFKVIGADDVLAELIARPRVMTRAAPSARDLRDIAKAIEVVNALGRLDIGQGAVVCEGLVLAVEAAEGTDRMLERCALLPAAIRGTPEDRRGVLVKLPKPRQELRVDLPTIGLPTIERAAAAGLAGIAVKAGGALIMDEASLIARADALGLFVAGIDASDDT